jgi:hypothetical protein
LHGKSLRVCGVWIKKIDNLTVWGDWYCCKNMLWCRSPLFQCLYIRFTLWKKWLM